MQHERGLSLPEPDPSSAAHSARAADYIVQRIAEAGGSISFAEFMHHALYAPGLGYYSAGATKFGTDGDFVTAPEVSPLFGRVLARQCADVLAEIDAASVLEFGAGSGKLAADILQALAAFDALPEEYCILEVSADLCERQLQFLRDAVPEHVARVRWLDRLPETHTGVIIANEVLDALPVQRFVAREGGIVQVRVAVDNGLFVMVERPADEPLEAAVRAIENDLGRTLPAGYVSEVSLALPAWIRDVARFLRHGIAFLFDYGVSRREYYAADRSGGWLRCHFRHHAHDDALRMPGIQDLTAWVDFSAVAGAAVAEGLEIAGYLPQAQFLIGGGLDTELEDLEHLSIDKRLELSRQVKLLTLPAEMGEHFKCLGLCRGPVRIPAAFKSADRTASL
jgi:SAM-dependent MidA family methyltransferase